MKILVTGSIAYDLLLRYDGSFPDAIDSVHLDDLSVAFVTPYFARHHGGTAANIAWNLRLLNQDPLLVGTVGDDGGSYLALLEERDIDTSSVETIEGKSTSTAIVATDSQEHQITFYHPGADGQGSWPDLADRREEMRMAIISPRDASMMIKAASFCSSHVIPYIFDPGQQVNAIPEDRLRAAIEGSRGVIANAYEWGMLAKRLNVSTDDLLALTPLLIVTQGEHGVAVHTRDEGDIIIPAATPDQVIDPTGAGDGFRAGLLTGLAADWSITDAARLGASVASFVVEQEGTLLNALDLNDVLGRAEVAYGEVLPEIF